MLKIQIKAKVSKKQKNGNDQGVESPHFCTKQWEFSQI